MRACVRACACLFVCLVCVCARACTCKFARVREGKCGWSACVHAGNASWRDAVQLPCLLSNQTLPEHSSALKEELYSRSLPLQGPATVVALIASKPTTNHGELTRFPFFPAICVCVCAFVSGPRKWWLSFGVLKKRWSSSICLRALEKMKYFQ